MKTLTGIKLLMVILLGNTALMSHAATESNDCYNCKLNWWVNQLEYSQQPSLTTAATSSMHEDYYKTQHSVYGNKRWAVIEKKSQHSIEDLENYLYQAPLFVYNELLDQNAFDRN